MRIYFDTKDIIEIIENSNPISSKELEKRFIEKNNELVISNTLLLEISDPLILNSQKTNVMNIINQIEMIPHIFIKTKNLIHLELLEAINAFNKREYKNIDPFTSRYTETIDFDTRFPLGKYIIYSLGEIFWKFYQERALGGFDKHSDRWRNVFSMERNLPTKQSKKDNFVTCIKKHLSMSKLRLSSQDIKSFSEWIYKKPSRCPSTRLINELFHMIVKNTDDIPKNSDLEDFVHIECLPYVDLMTVDRRFYAYIYQVSKSINFDYKSKIRKSAKEILDYI